MTLESWIILFVIGFVLGAFFIKHPWITLTVLIVLGLYSGIIPLIMVLGPMYMMGALQ